MGFHIRHRTAGAVCAGEVNHLIVASDRKHGNIGRYGIAGFIAVPIFIRPIQLRVFRNAVRTRQPFSSGGGEALAIFHDDLNILGAITQLSAAKVKGNGFQPVRAQCVGVQDFKDGAETDARAGERSIVAVPVAGRIVPANRTERRVVSCCVLPPRIYAIPVFDVAAVLVQHRVPLIALGRAAFYIARACMTTSHRRRTQRIAHAAGDIVLAENQTFVIQATPANRIRYGIVRHKQAVGVFVLLCIFLGGRHRRRELVGFYCSRIGKGNIVQRRIRQRNCSKWVSAVCCAGNIHRRQVKIVSAAGGKGKLF